MLNRGSFLRFYQDDKVLNHYDAWERPPVASVYTVYGVNMPVSAL